MLKNKSYLLIFGIFLYGVSIVQAQSNQPFSLNLAGKWNFKMDPKNEGLDKQWFNASLPGTINLPGSMTSNHLGDEISIHTLWTGSILDSSYFSKPAYAKYRVPGHIKIPFWLQPEKYYKGAAWYQKNINVPASWKGKHVQLFLERPHWQTTVWIDNQQVGSQNSLGTAHVFDLGAISAAGTHRITIRVDNAVRDLDVGQNSHSISDHTQTNWNGIVGQLLLKAIPAISINDVQLYPDVKHKIVRVNIRLNNVNSGTKSVEIKLRASASNNLTNTLNTITKKILVSSKDSVIELVCPFKTSPLLWSEAHPNLYQMNISVSNGQNVIDQKKTTFGMREFKAEGSYFTINGVHTMLRGTLECAAFPITGFPPTDLAYWMKELKKCKDYGLNHLRFHSWCPPEAAFEAADRLGIYLQIECSSWGGWTTTIGDGGPLDNYLYEESRNIAKAYGNHPSFCLLAYGNEPSGKHLVDYLRKFVTYWKEKDSRRVYTSGAGWPIIEESNYNSTDAPRIAHGAPILKTVINSKPPSSDYDWSKAISRFKNPTVSHEIGQWCVYPDFTEISKYTGVLKAKNFEIFRDTLQANGLGALAPDFLYASGKLQTLCYKAEIEAALRTKDFGGFQLLGLSDFPGQGTALVGVINAFWEDKGYVNAPQFSAFCNKVVPLVRMPKMIYNNDEALDIPVEVAQFSEGALKNITPSWDIRNTAGKVLFQGKLSKQNIPVGNGIILGHIRSSLANIKSASRLILTVNVAGYKNNWSLFVYPRKNPESDPGILVTQVLDAKASDILQKGGKVLLTLKKGTLKKELGGDINIAFSSIFWNTAWVKGNVPYTLGILCDPTHPALRKFPTEKYSDWQWWDAMSHSNAIKLDSVAKGLKPIVRVIDDWVTARSLGLVFECRVGNGKLLVSSIDLLSEAKERPEARQLLFSLENYMGQPAFAPTQPVDINRLNALVK
ncbi:sugar-binding domain-containing protein [Mucilaginibacter sp. UYCu711]|uniref:sugar-binding domain-containing protein n=1 Tax=Mucilaginibacter sp. UYCu711 TaxID=3156339 RepID=UPI003D1B1970